MTRLQPHAQRIVDIIESQLRSPFSDLEADYRQEVQQMIWDLGGANLPPSTSLASATNYLLMLWLSRGAP